MLKIKELTFGYKGHNPLFTQLDLALSAGGICGLLGKNGAGKTTLLKIIAGLVFSVGGQCQVLGHIPGARHPDFLSELYFLPEDIYVPALTIDEYVTCYAVFYPRFDYQAFKTYLNEFEITERKLLTTFSHGQKKKFLIAFGLATNCKLLIMDEPSNGLDIPSKMQFKRLLASVITDEKLIIISTHQVHDVENIIDSIVILDNGQVILNERLFAITKRLAFKHAKTDCEIEAALYLEKIFGGYAVITENDGSQDTQIDLEVLFNAVLANANKITKAFKGVSHE